MFAKPMKYDIANDVEIFGDCLVILHTIPSYKNKSIFMNLLNLDSYSKVTLQVTDQVNACVIFRN